MDKIRVEVRKAQVARNLSDEQTMQLFQQNFEHSLDQLIGAAAWVKVAPWLLRLRRARLAAVGRPALPRGAQPRPRVAAVGRRSMVKAQSGQCPCSAPVPGGSGRLGTPREAVGRRPTGRPATSWGAAKRGAL